METKPIALNPADETALAGFSARSREMLRHFLTSPGHQAEFMESEADRVATRRSLVDQLAKAKRAAQLASEDAAAEKRLQKLHRELEVQREQVKATEAALRETANLIEAAKLMPALEAINAERLLRSTADTRLLDLRIELQKLSDAARGRLDVKEFRMKNWVGQLRLECVTNREEVQWAVDTLAGVVATTFELELAAMSFDEVTASMVSLCEPELAAALKPLDLSPPWIHASTFQVMPPLPPGAVPHPDALKPKT